MQVVCTKKYIVGHKLCSKREKSKVNELNGESKEKTKENVNKNLRKGY